MDAEGTGCPFGKPGGGKGTQVRILEVGPIPPEVGGSITGGVATHTWGLSTHLAKRGHEVAILADNFSNPPQVPVVKDSVRIYGFSKALILRHLPSVWLNIPTLIKLERHFKGLCSIRGIIADLCYYDYVLHHFKPHIIHAHHIEYRFPFAHFVSKRRVSLVTSVHSISSIKLSTPTQSQRYYRLVADNLKLSQDLIFVSKSLERECKELFQNYRAKSCVINNPIDTTRYYSVDKDKARQRVGLPSEIPILLFVGKLIKTKGIYTLLKAIKILKEKGKELKIVIVGDGPERSGIEDFIAKNGIGDIVKVEGQKQYPELLYYYNAADLFVMPSFSEGFAIVYLEALACGIPAIGIKGLADESIPSEDYGFLIPRGDARELAKAIERGLNKAWDREKIVTYARSFDWDKRIAEFEKVYKEIKAKR